MGAVILRDPGLLLFVDEVFGKIEVNLVTHVFVRAFGALVHAFILIKMSKPISVELSALLNLLPEAVFEERVRWYVFLGNS